MFGLLMAWLYKSFLSEGECRGFFFVTRVYNIILTSPTTPLGEPRTRRLPDLLLDGFVGDPLQWRGNNASEPFSKSRGRALLACWRAVP